MVLTVKKGRSLRPFFISIIEPQTGKFFRGGFKFEVQQSLVDIRVLDHFVVAHILDDNERELGGQPVAFVTKM
ncbi:MAG: hypothetical protein A2Z94_00715 [Gallionellales bacterium GWA2_55_18]|nr:MAG: hypothetical protein A2Z94_00715 [Gallionellales bacterium GWA2_55_18]